MRLEYYPSEKLSAEIRTICDRVLVDRKYSLFYFGSRVTGKNSDRSDIDVGIQSPSGITAQEYFQITDAIDWIPTLYTVDFVDFDDVSDEFRSVALRNIEYIVQA